MGKSGKTCTVPVIAYLELECLVIFLSLFKELFQGARWHVLCDEYHLAKKKPQRPKHYTFILASCLFSNFEMIPQHFWCSHRIIILSIKINIFIQTLTLGRPSLVSVQYLWNFTMFGWSSWIRLLNTCLIFSYKKAFYLLKSINKLLLKIKTNSINHSICI